VERCDGEKMAERSSEVALGLGRLLGFERVAALTHDDGGLAEALGGACNKVGGETPEHRVDVNAIPLGTTRHKGD
jgi:hypothetical protein